MILFDYVEVFYNGSRHQVDLDDRSPAETYAAARAAWSVMTGVHEIVATPLRPVDRSAEFWSGC